LTGSSLTVEDVLAADVWARAEAVVAGTIGQEGGSGG
jgi:hypothetical protein